MANEVNIYSPRYLAEVVRQAQLPGGIGLHQQAVIVLVAPHPELFLPTPGRAAIACSRVIPISSSSMPNLRSILLTSWFVSRFRSVASLCVRSCCGWMQVISQR